MCDKSTDGQSGQGKRPPSLRQLTLTDQLAGRLSSSGGAEGPSLGTLWRGGDRSADEDETDCDNVESVSGLDTPTKRKRSGKSGVTPDAKSSRAASKDDDKISAVLERDKKMRLKQQQRPAAHSPKASYAEMAATPSQDASLIAYVFTKKSNGMMKKDEFTSFFMKLNVVIGRAILSGDLDHRFCVKARRWTNGRGEVKFAPGDNLSRNHFIRLSAMVEGGSFEVVGRENFEQRYKASFFFSNDMRLFDNNELLPLLRAHNSDLLMGECTQEHVHQAIGGRILRVRCDSNMHKSIKAIAGSLKCAGSQIGVRLGDDSSEEEVSDDKHADGSVQNVSPQAAGGGDDGGKSKKMNKK